MRKRRILIGVGLVLLSGVCALVLLRRRAARYEVLLSEGLPFFPASAGALGDRRDLLLVPFMGQHVLRFSHDGGLQQDPVLSLPTFVNRCVICPDGDGGAAVVASSSVYAVGGAGLPARTAIALRLPEGARFLADGRLLVWGDPGVALVGGKGSEGWHSPTGGIVCDVDTDRPGSRAYAVTLDHDVFAIDLADGRVVRKARLHSLRLHVGPHIAITGESAYVVSGCYVVRLDTASLAEVARLELPGEPLGIHAAAPDGPLYVWTEGEAESVDPLGLFARYPGRLHQVDWKCSKVIANLELEFDLSYPWAVSPGGRYLYLGGDGVAVVDLTRMRLVCILPVRGRLRYVAPGPLRRTLWIVSGDLRGRRQWGEVRLVHHAPTPQER